MEASVLVRLKCLIVGSCFTDCPCSGYSSVWIFRSPRAWVAPARYKTTSKCCFSS
jgi:hypothetical protein